MTTSHKKLSILIILVIIIAIAAFWYLRHLKLYPSTDDSYVQANIVNIAAQVTGPITAVYVQDHEAVKKGQALFDILPTNYQAALAEATAKQIQAKKNADRMLALVAHGNVSKSIADQAIEDAHVAEAALAEAQLNMQFTHVTAPADGILANFNLRVGSTVTPGVILFALVENHQWWVDANYKETQLDRIKPGQSAEIYVDMYPNHKFEGTVQQISAGSGAAFSLLPPEDATGNWVKVTQRFPVKVIIKNPDPNYPLRVGASATVTINTVK